MPKKPGEGNLKDAVSFSLSSSATTMSLPFSIGQAAIKICKIGGMDLLNEICSTAGKAFGVAGLSSIFIDAMSKCQDEDGFTEAERLDVAVNLVKTGSLALAFSAVFFHILVGILSVGHVKNFDFDVLVSQNLDPA